MDNKTDNWKDLYAKPIESEEQLGPVFFYNETLIDHFTNPRNVGEMKEDEANGYSLISDPSCGDQMKLWIKVVSDRIVDIKFKSFGCPGAIASSSMLTVLAKGKTIEEARRLTDDDVIEGFGGIPERKKHCSLLGVGALHEAIKDYEQRETNRKKE